MDSCFAEQDLGVLMDYKVAFHGILLAKKANRILECIKRSAARSLRRVILPLYSALGWLHLECYVVQFCIPQSKRDMDLLGQVRQQPTKMAYMRRG